MLSVLSSELCGIVGPIFQRHTLSRGHSKAPIELQSEPMELQVRALDSLCQWTDQQARRGVIILAGIIDSYQQEEVGLLLHKGSRRIRCGIQVIHLGTLAPL